MGLFGEVVSGKVFGLFEVVVIVLFELVMLVMLAVS